MASETEICNLALSMIGQQPIMTIENPSSLQEQFCNLWYPHARDSVIEAYDWTFAMARAKLTVKQTDAPTFGFANAFLIPDNALRVIWFGEQPNEKLYTEADWRLEGRNILTDFNAGYLRYVRRENNTTFYSPLVIQAIAARLAMELCVPITENVKLEELLVMKFGQKLGEAKANDGMQGRSEKIRSQKLLLRR